MTISGTYHPARNFGYTYTGMGHMLTITENTNLSNYTATVTTDANGNLTEIEEVRDVSGTPTTVSTNTFEYDRENRLIEQIVDSNQNVTVAHAYDGLGRLVRTSRTVSGPTTTQYRHVRDGLKLQGNVDYTNTQTAPSWTNHPGRLMPIESQQLQTNNSQQFINIADEFTPARLTYHPSTSAAGDTSTVNAKGSYSVINGSAPPVNATTLHSELFYHRNATVNQNSIALSSDRGSLEIAGVSLLYEGTRVKSYLLGRDLNPMGRGDGNYYPHGAFGIGNVRPIPTTSIVSGFGNSINNGCGGSNKPCDLLAFEYKPQEVAPKSQEAPLISPSYGKYLVGPDEGCTGINWNDFWYGCDIYNQMYPDRHYQFECRYIAFVNCTFCNCWDQSLPYDPPPIPLPPAGGHGGHGGGGQGGGGGGGTRPKPPKPPPTPGVPPGGDDEEPPLDEIDPCKIIVKIINMIKKKLRGKSPTTIADEICGLVGQSGNGAVFDAALKCFCKVLMKIASSGELGLWCGECTACLSFCWGLALKAFPNSPKDQIIYYQNCARSCKIGCQECMSKIWDEAKVCAAIAFTVKGCQEMIDKALREIG